MASPDWNAGVRKGSTKKKLRFGERRFRGIRLRKNKCGTWTSKKRKKRLIVHGLGIEFAGRGDFEKRETLATGMSVNLEKIAKKSNRKEGTVRKRTGTHVTESFAREKGESPSEQW